MEKWKNAPTPLKRKIFLTVLVGMLCALIGIAMCICVKDTVMFVLSIALCGICFYKAFTLYRIAAQEQYEIVEGICISIVPKPLQKFRKIKIADDDGNETMLLLNKNSKIAIGDRYRFYFKKTTRVTLGNEYFDTTLTSDCFLGYESVSKT